MKYKKSQMELMGLAIIVILLSLAMLFVIRFVILKEPSQQTKEYTQSELAANFLNTLLETNAPECSNVNFGTLFMDCANNNNNGGSIPCGTTSISEYSCSYITQTLPGILNKTFDQWKVKYRFIATTEPNNIFDPSPDTIITKKDSGCDDTMNRKGKIQPLPSNPPINIALFICE